MSRRDDSSVAALREVTSALDEVIGAVEDLDVDSAIAALEFALGLLRARCAMAPKQLVAQAGESAAIAEEALSDAPEVAAKPAEETVAEGTTLRDRRRRLELANEAALERDIKSSEVAGRALETKIRNVLLAIRALGEGATTSALAAMWKISGSGVSFRCKVAVSRKLIEPPPRGGRGERPYRLTGKAVEWLEKHRAERATA